VRIGHASGRVRGAFLGHRGDAWVEEEARCEVLLRWQFSAEKNTDESRQPLKKRNLSRGRGCAATRERTRRQTIL